MEFRILGSFEVVGTTEPIDVRGAKRRGLLACLLVHAGQPLSSERLVEELWRDPRSEGAARTVQTYVSQLRKLLRDEPARLETRPDGYVLEIDPGDVDAHRFEQAMNRAGAETDPARRLAGLNGALELWRGPPLREFAGAGWADREATRLETRHLQALQHRYDALMALDRAREAAGELELLVHSHPLDERLWAQLMLALYRTGRQADALAAYQKARRHLIEELGIEPGPELVTLEQRILDQDPTLAAAAPPASTSADQGTIAGGWYPRTFLLTDIVDSVSLWERDPEAMSIAVARHDALVSDAVNAAGGELVRSKGEGDSTFSVFAHPVPALAAATAIQSAITAEQWPSAAPLRARAGVHTGDAERREGDWYGPSVNRAARLRALADPGHTLLSGVAAGLAADQPPPGMRLLYQGRRVLRGIERPEDVWELVAADDDQTLAGDVSGTIVGLPVASTSFVGRVRDLDALATLVEAERLVTLTGPGGSGKTRLALELAKRAARHGKVPWLAELAPLRDGGLVAQVVATAVGIEIGPEPLQDLLARPELLAGLLVLDNCEHLLDACAAFTTAALAAAPELHVLVTSREPLGLAGEHEWPVGPLELPNESLRDREQLARLESVQLLLDRARSVRPDIDLHDDDVAAVVDTCRALDGIPLAIELAASRLRSLSLTDLSEHLSDQLHLLARHRSAGPGGARHQTLRITLDWSYDLLTDQQRTLAHRLSVFAGGFRLDSVEAVCGSGLDVLDGIDELVAKSWVTFDPVTARYRLLEPLRQYLARRLDEADETETIQRAHATAVAGLCDRLGTRLLDDQRSRSRRLREETGNIDLALQWALDHDQALAVRIAGALGQYWFFHDQASGRRWCGPVIDAATDVAPLTRAMALLNAGVVAQNDHEWDRAVSRLREALDIYRAEDVVAGQAPSLFHLGVALGSPWNPEHSENQAEETRCFEESLRLYERLGDWVGVGWCRNLLSEQAFSDEHPERSERLAEQVVEQCSAAGAHHPVPRALSILAFIAHVRGRDHAALEMLQDAAAISRQLDDPGQLAYLLANLSVQQTALRRGAEALQSLAESAQLDEQIGRVARRSWTLAAAAVLHLARGQPAMATRALGAHDAHTRPNTGMPGDVGGYISILSDAISATRARLDAAEVATAAVAARRLSPDQLIDELIIQAANMTT